MSIRSAVMALLLLAIAAPLRADPPEDKPLPGERVGGDGQDIRATKRIETRLPTRLETRVRPRTIGKPLVAANSRIVSDAENGCARDTAQPATQAVRTAQSAPSCQGPQ